MMVSVIFFFLIKTEVVLHLDFLKKITINYSHFLPIHTLKLS